MVNCSNLLGSSSLLTAGMYAAHSWCFLRGIFSVSVEEEKSFEPQWKRGGWNSVLCCYKLQKLLEEKTGFVFFRFPKDKERSKKWVQNSRKEDLLGRT
ncbi:hypothetical protein Pcinc_023606 [Petrolisthes cinctipes]|uniref:THAP-type domain-containing protein n=1 Tax=Petrolisthes cinctipes TaxID=88211 RepID=A0AAE1FBH3_PETCI|nr:hypothetical protein Pcinc_023606 [Petrolisthes cinctipes]